MSITVYVQGPYPATMSRDYRLMFVPAIDTVISVSDEVFNDKLALMRKVFTTRPPFGYTDDQIRRDIERSFEFDVVGYH